MDLEIWSEELADGHQGSQPILILAISFQNYFKFNSYSGETTPLETFHVFHFSAYEQ